MHALVVCAVVLTAAPPLEEDIDFQEGKRLVDELDYERAVFRFQKLAKSDRPAEQRAAAFAWLGLTYANLGDEGEAIKAFVAAIKLDPLVVLPPSSPKVVQIFDKARKAAREERKVDGDGDGIADAEDRCPVAPETKNDHEDQDGCPDAKPAAVPVDADGDGLASGTDGCPDAPETKNGFQDHDGCPDVAPPPPPRSPPFLLIGGAVAAGAGVLSLGGGAVLGMLATSANEDALAKEFQDERAAGAATAGNFAAGANVAYVVGSLLVVAGGALAATALIGGDA